jgi:tetratricopeptide (TPR) repeat protein
LRTVFSSPVLNNLGRVATFQANYDSAQQYFCQAIRYARELDEGPVRTILYCNLLNNLALTHRYRGEFEQARALLEEALALDRAAGNLEAISARLRNLGMLFGTKEIMKRP